MLGEAAETANRTAASGGRGRGRRPQASSWGRPGSCSSARREKRLRLSLWAQRQGEGWPVVMGVLVGVLGRSRRSRERETEEETGTRESERGSGRLRGVSRDVQREAASRRWPSVHRRASATRSVSSWRGGEDDWQGQLAGPASWAASARPQVRPR